MAEAGDIINEWKQAKPPEKAVIVLGIVAVIGVTVYLYKKGTGGSASTAAPAAAATPTSGYPTAGGSNTPVLPSGVNPLYDPNGNLIAFQNPPTPTTNGQGSTTTGSGNGLQPGGGSGPPPKGGPIGGSLNWFQQAFGSKAEISQQNGNFLLVQRGAGNKITNTINLASLFPKGTKFTGGASGQAFAVVPGSSSPMLLTSGGYGRPMIPSKTQTAKTAAGGSH